MSKEAKPEGHEAPDVRVRHRDEQHLPYLREDWSRVAGSLYELVRATEWMPIEGDQRACPYCGSAYTPGRTTLEEGVVVMLGGRRHFEGCPAVEAMEAFHRRLRHDALLDIAGPK